MCYVLTTNQKDVYTTHWACKLQTIWCSNKGLVLHNANCMHLELASVAGARK